MAAERHITCALCLVKQSRDRLEHDKLVAQQWDRKQSSKKLNGREFEGIPSYEVLGSVVTR